MESLRQGGPRASVEWKYFSLRGLAVRWGEMMVAGRRRGEERQPQGGSEVQWGGGIRVEG